MFTGRSRRIDQVVMTGVLISLLTKIQWFFVGFRIYQMLPLRDDFFPPVLQSSWVFLGAYLAAVCLATVSLVIRSRTAKLANRAGLLGCLFVLCIHQQTYNDVTFVTCFWTVTWSIWFVWETERRPEQEVLEMASTFSQLVLSLIFLGGVVGKMTPGYWNGEVLHDIYFESRNYWCFNWIREHVPAKTIPELARWYSRLIILMEWTCSLLWIMPRRIASMVALVTLLGIAILSNFLLFSVVGCLIGLALVGLLVPPRVRAGVDETDEVKANRQT
jgi:hypothetical protein